MSEHQMCFTISNMQHIPASHDSDASMAAVSLASRLATGYKDRQQPEVRCDGSRLVVRHAWLAVMFPVDHRRAGLPK